MGVIASCRRIQIAPRSCAGVGRSPPIGWACGCWPTAPKLLKESDNAGARPLSIAASARNILSTSGEKRVGESTCATRLRYAIHPQKVQGRTAMPGPPSCGQAEVPSLGDCFAALNDPRGGAPRRHDLPEIMTIALCATLAGAQTAVDMAVFAEAKREFLGRFLQLKNGVPSHDTFSRAFRQLDPDELRACFQIFVRRFPGAGSSVIAIDGKALQRPSDRARPGSALRMISAWCCERRLVLAQIAAHAKVSEGEAVLELLENLRLGGAIVTTDALNCRRDIGRRIVERGGDYVLALKGNQQSLHADVARLFADPKHPPCDGYATHDSLHGRIEQRVALVASEIDWLQDRYRWPGLTAVGRIIRSRQTLAGQMPKKTTETAYYLLSSALTPERLGHVVRSHWGVENRLHWVLNVVMNEGQVRSCGDQTLYNLAILRHMALNLMHKDQSRVSLRGKLNLAGWRDDFLVKLLAQA